MRRKNILHQNSKNLSFAIEVTKRHKFQEGGFFRRVVSASDCRYSRNLSPLSGGGGETLFLGGRGQ